MLNGFPDNFRMGDDDVLNEFRQKQVNFDLEERRNEINNSRSLFIGALAGLALAGVVGWFVLAPEYQKENVDDVPVIRRPQEQVKMPPAEPGGIEISNQEKTVYDIIERKAESVEDATVMPQAEQPNAQAMEALVDNVTDEEETVITTTTTTPIKAESLAVPGGKVVQTETPAEAVAAAPVEKVVTSAPVANTIVPPAEQTKTEAVKPEAAKPVAEETPKVENAKTEIAKGAWQIQLMSSPNKPAVEKSWKSMAAKYAVLSNMPYEISGADLGAKGTYYRLKAGNFASKEEATAACNKLKAAGGSCFVAKK